MLETFVNGAASTVSSLASSGSAWWGQTACSYSFVQTYIGYCPSICDNLPFGLVGICETALPYVNMIGVDNLFYGSLAIGTAAATTYTAWRAYNDNPQMTVNLIQVNNNIKPEILEEISRQLKELQTQFKAFQAKIETLTPEEAADDVDLIKRARYALEGYMQQAGVSDIFYGDKIREMGLELLEKRKQQEPLFHDSEDIPAKEKARVTRIIDKKAEESRKRREAKGPAFSLHIAKSEEEKAALDLVDRKSLLEDIKKLPKSAATY